MPINPADNIILGMGQYMSKTKAKLAKEYPPLQVGDIVASFKFYSNGRPVPPHKRRYIDDTTGIVIGEFHHPVYDTTALRVKWNDGTKDTLYVKESSGSYLVKLS
jgi:hypothetical protein